MPAKSNKWKVGASVSILLAQKNESGFLKTGKRIIGFFNDEKMDKENEAGERAGWRKSAGALMARDLRFGL